MKHYHVTFYGIGAIKVCAQNEKEAQEKAVARMNEIIAHIAIANPHLENVSAEDIAAIEIED